MKITVQNYSFSKRKSNYAKSIIEKFMKRIVGKENYSDIKAVKVVLMRNWGKDNYHRGVVFTNMWNSEMKTVTLAIAPNWSNDNLDMIAYGIKHELVHLRDVMNEWIVSEKPKGKDKIRIWYVNDKDKRELYTKIAPKWLLKKMWNDKDVSYRSWFDVLTQYYPWEYDALTVDKWCR